MARQLASFATAREIAHAAALDTVDAAAVAASVTNLGIVNVAALAIAVTDSITAHAGGGHADATALTAFINNLGTVATNADSVVLPTMTAGEVCIVSNQGAASAQVFGAGTATINGVATDTGVALAAGKTGIYAAVTASKIVGGALA
jgi:hypothetical protein